MDSLKVLCRNKWIDEFPPASPQHRMDLSTCTSEVSIVVEGFPQVVDRSLARLRPRVEEADDSWVEVSSDRIEEPAVAVDLLGVLVLQSGVHVSLGIDSRWNWTYTKIIWTGTRLRLLGLREGLALDLGCRNGLTRRWKALRVLAPKTWTAGLCTRRCGLRREISIGSISN
jgi:hypothetical protein